MAPEMTRFSLFGIPVTIQPFFWAAMGILGFISHQNSEQVVMLVALFIIAGTISILIHELGHALTGKFFGAYPEIVLHGFGGFAAFHGAGFSRGQAFLVTLAGPAFQFVAGYLAMLAYQHSGIEPSLLGHAFIKSFIIVSIAWAILNLIPVVPLDGGQLLLSALGPRRVRLTLTISIITAIVGAVLLLLYTGSIFMPLFLAAFAWQNYEAIKQQRF